MLIAGAKVLLSSVGIVSLISADIAHKSASLTVNSLGSIYNYLTINANNNVINKYKNELESFDIELKLELAKNWINSINSEEIKKNKNIELIYNSLTKSINNIETIINEIEYKILMHKNLYFSSWRTIDLESEIRKLEKEFTIFNERLKITNFFNK
jgi:hypothetical protein